MKSFSEYISSNESKVNEALFDFTEVFNKKPLDPSDPAKLTDAVAKAVCDGIEQQVRLNYNDKLKFKYEVHTRDNEVFNIQVKTDNRVLKDSVLSAFYPAYYLYFTAQFVVSPAQANKAARCNRYVYGGVHIQSSNSSWSQNLFDGKSFVFDVEKFDNYLEK